jgi:uncharacterized protein
MGAYRFAGCLRSLTFLESRRFGMKFEMYRDPTGQYRWRLRASNGEIIASGESYRNRQDCINAVNLVMDTGRKTTFVEG